MWIQVLDYKEIGNDGEVKRYWVWASPTAGSTLMENPTDRWLPCN